MSSRFNKQAYIEAEPWLDDAYLVIPPGTKVCKLCEKNQYSTWFLTCDGFTDHKLPVCFSCLRGKDKQEAMKIIEDAGVTMVCRKCGSKKTVEKFHFSDKMIEVRNICDDCYGGRTESA